MTNLQNKPIDEQTQHSQHLFASEKLIAVIDTPDIETARTLIRQTRDVVGCYKFGLEFCYANSLKDIQSLQDEFGGFEIFLDLKLHDIPAQIEGAVRSCLSLLKPKFLTLHISGGREMLKRAMKAKQEISPDTILLGVSVLTALDNDDLKEVGQTPQTNEQVFKLASLASDVYLDGMVCSGQDLETIKDIDIIKVTPGIRLEDGTGTHSSNDDQKRVMTPYNAIKDGADYLVVGRSISKSDDPLEASRKIIKQIELALN